MVAVRKQSLAVALKVIIQSCKYIFLKMRFPGKVQSLQSLAPSVNLKKKIGAKITLGYGTGPIIKSTKYVLT